MSETTEVGDGLESHLLKGENEILIDEESIRKLTWKKLTSTITGTNKMILKDLSGSAREGELVAIIGTSGAGKTTLLNILGQKMKKSTAKITGDINYMIKGKNSIRQLRSESSFLRQDDIFHSNITPREAMSFAMDLQTSDSQELKKERIKDLLEQLNLMACADTRIGNFEHRGISGGEKRRLSLAIEMIKDPFVVFADEPTSGLDSFSAYLIMNILKLHAK